MTAFLLNKNTIAEGLRDMKG